ncbi:Do family serine endopeptidase [Acetobacteraceae bacterium KSS8]|uniref:Probable periplasmic serine endoprotease DegP-like n=1 Tax=Endosaccharibacter trunci TaxID=2812733 RepID=A0ABT1W3F2_9PROT|nr:Do family serine endopeptidase [Acetobacteraceae bacterium KSS8]
MTDQTPTTTPRRRFHAGVLAASLACGTALGGFALGSSPAVAQNAIQPSGMKQKLPDFVDLVKQVRPAVVSITSMIKDDGTDDDEDGGNGGGMNGGGQQMPFPFPFPFPMQPQNRGSRTIEARGSGFIISPDGYIVTNNHVIKHATSVTVTLDDGTTLKAKVVGHDAGTDLALLKVKPSSKLNFIDLGESDDVQPGQWVIAVGNPFGLGGSVTAGIVSARGRDIGDGPYDSFIQVDAPINRGNSGGPLITQDGKVVGVNTAILSPSGGSVGIGFAIPSDVVKNVVAQLEKTGHVTRGYLGVTAQEITPGMAKALSLPTKDGAPATGALVASVQGGSPAEKAGIKAGDVITSFNDQKVSNPRDLAIKVSGVAPGSKAQVSWLRNGSTQSATVTVANLAKHDADSGTGSGNGNGSLGVSLSPLTPDLRQQLGIDDSIKGVVIRDVRQGSAADQAGLSAGDVIVAVGNHAVTNPKDAVAAVHAALHGSGTVALRVLHQGQMLFVAVTPGDNSATPDNGDSDNGDSGNDGGSGGGDTTPG